MNATVLHGARDLRVEEVPDAKILEPTDAVMRVFCACTCAATCGPTRISTRATVRGSWATRRSRSSRTSALTCAR